MHIAAERGLPKELLQRMQLLKVLATQSLEFEYNALTKGHFHEKMLHLGRQKILHYQSCHSLDDRYSTDSYASIMTTERYF